MSNNINLNVKVYAGKRTPIQVEVTCTAVNSRTLTLPSGNQVPDIDIAQWIADNLSEHLDEIDKVDTP